MKHVALITARGNNESIQDKNLTLVNDSPLIEYSLKAALDSKLIDKVYVSTECDKIKKFINKYNDVEIINRPLYLSQPDSNHGDVIVHATKFIKDKYGSFETITILLGNTVMTKATDIDQSIQSLLNDNDANSCMTVWKAQDDHPYRAMKINSKGYLESFLNTKNISTNRQSYPEVLFYDQGPWTAHMNTILESVKKKDGPGPWWWMGKNVAFIERLWVTGRDVHSRLDLDISKFWLDNYSEK